MLVLSQKLNIPVPGVQTKSFSVCINTLLGREELKSENMDSQVN